MKVFYAVPNEGQSPLLDFMIALDPKLRQKIFSQFVLLLNTPIPCEPHVKHFSIEKYSELYELRTRSKIMVRIIFTIKENSDILLLIPFIKKHKRNTMQALDASLKLLKQINNGTYSEKELLINELLEESK